MKIDELVLSLVMDVAGLKKGMTEFQKNMDEMVAGSAAATKKVSANDKQRERDARTAERGAAKAARDKALADKNALRALNKQTAEQAKADKQMQDDTSKKEQAFTKWMWSIAKAGAALVALNKIKNFAVNITNADADVGRWAQAIGMAVKDLSALQHAVEYFGGTADDVTQSLFGISQAVAKIRVAGEMPDWISNAAFWNVPGNMAKFVSDSTTMMERVKMIHDSLKGLSDQDKIAHAGYWGITPFTSEMLGAPDAQYEKLMAKMQQFAASGKDSKAAITRKNDWLDITNKLERMGGHLLTNLTPTLDAAAKSVFGLLDALSKADFNPLYVVLKGIVDLVNESVTGLSLIVAMGQSKKSAEEVGADMALAGQGLWLSIREGLHNTAAGFGRMAEGGQPSFYPNAANSSEGRFLHGLIGPNPGQTATANSGARGSTTSNNVEVNVTQHVMAGYEGKAANNAVKGAIAPTPVGSGTH
jgi:hypothetical protein